jgi:hypothetical protein
VCVCVCVCTYIPVHPDTTVVVKDIGDLRFVFLCRTVLGTFIQVGAHRKTQLGNPSEAVFAAGVWTKLLS